MLVKTNYIKTVGPNAILRILVDELQPLEKNGVSVNGSEIFIASVLFLGDNMGLNYNLGIQGYRGSYFCRICFMPRIETETCCEENPDFIRTKEHYDMCINALALRNGNSFGVKFNTNLNKLKAFDFEASLVADIMHDLLSGVLVYGLVELLKKAIDSKKFSLRNFNEEKNSFDYGPKEKHYRIGEITANHLSNHTIRCHSREMLTITKYLPAILSKLLPGNCPLRKFSGIMHDLLQICLKNSFSEEDLTELSATVFKFNSEFLRLFNANSERPLPPKAHHLLHYTRIIRNSGPLKSLWSMRFEAKHQEAKAYAKVCNSRINLCFSIGKKISYNCAHKILKNDDIFQKVSEIKVSGKRFLYSSENLNSDYYESCYSVRINGTLYAVNDFILSNCLQHAYKILDIGISNIDNYSVLAVRTYNVSYDRAIRMYVIQEHFLETTCKRINELLYPPINVHKFNGSFYLHHEQF